MIWPERVRRLLMGGRSRCPLRYRRHKGLYYEDRVFACRVARSRLAAPSASGQRADFSEETSPLVLGEEKGYRHESVSHALATIEHLGEKTGLWDTTIRTDTEVLTKKKLEYNAKNLNDFDAVLFFTGGELEMDSQQKADLLSFVHDDGEKGLSEYTAPLSRLQRGRSMEK